MVIVYNNLDYYNRFFYLLYGIDYFNLFENLCV